MDEKAVKDTQEINLRAGAKRRSEDARSQVYRGFKQGR